MTPPVITDDLFLHAASRIKNWKSPWLDGLHGFLDYMWALPLIRYTAGIIKWSLCELKQLDISTQKLFALYRCINVNDDLNRLYASGRGLLSVEDTASVSVPTVVFPTRISI